MDAAPGDSRPGPSIGMKEDRGTQRAILIAAGTLGLALLAAGGILWSSRGQAVFVDMLASALALCF